MSGASKKRCQTNIVRLRRKELPPAGTFCAAPAPTLGTATNSDERRAWCQRRAGRARPRRSR